MLLRTLLVCAAVTWPGIAAAQDAAAPVRPPADTFDLTRAIRVARDRNPMLAARADEVRAAGARTGAAGAWADPVVTLGAMNYMLPGLSPSGDPMTMNQLTVMQMLPLSGVPGSRRSAARADSARTDLARQAAALDVEHGVRTGYWELYHADRALDVMRQRQVLLRDVVTAATAMYGVGRVPQSDVLRAQVALTQLAREIIEMEQERYAAAVRFNLLLGRGSDEPVALPASSAHAAHGAAVRTLDLAEPAPLDSLLVLARGLSPDLRADSAAVTAARARETVASRERWPDIGVGAAYGQRAGLNDMVTLMVSASVPIWGRQRAVRDEARAMTDAASREFEAARQRLAAEVVMARSEAMTARRQVDLYAGTLVPQAEAAREAVLAAYRVGRADIGALLEAETMLLEYQHDLHRYEAAFGAALADLDRLTGRSLVPDAPEAR
jgi:outer membrane protein TolC